MKILFQSKFTLSPYFVTSSHRTPKTIFNYQGYQKTENWLYRHCEKNKFKLTALSTNFDCEIFMRRTIWNISTPSSTFNWSNAFMHAMNIPPKDAFLYKKEILNEYIPTKMLEVLPLQTSLNTSLNLHLIIAAEELEEKLSGRANVKKHAHF